MVPQSAAKSARPSLSLYANLLDPSPNKDSAHGTISRPPVVFKQPAEEDPPQDRAASEKQQMSAASLRFQPTKRPQLSGQKPKTKPTIPRPLTAAPSPLLSEEISAESAGVTGRPPVKTTLADWTVESQDNDISGFYGGEKRQRGGRKKRKKNKEEYHFTQNWDDIYDPSRPNSYEDYKHSEERTMEIREWKDKLYAHRSSKRQDSGSDSSGNDYRPQLYQQFAPPGPPSALPLPFGNHDHAQHDPHTIEGSSGSTGDDVCARTSHLSQFDIPAKPVDYKSFAHQGEPPSVSPPPVLDPTLPSPAPAASISRAPVRYNLHTAPLGLPCSDAELEDALKPELQEEEVRLDDTPRSLRPGQKGFAERLMSKYGWSKGSGLGASESGIVNPLRVQIEKQKKKPDSEGGGFVRPGGRGKIIGGRKKGAPDADLEGKFGIMSEVVVLRGMVDGMDLDVEMEGAGEGGLMQEIGEECGDKYGRVERVFIDRSDASKAPVFIKFTSQLSALRAVNALEGRVFNGNVISARFFDKEKFEAGDYE